MTTYEDCFIKTQLLSCSFKHLCLVCVAGDQSVDLNLTFLTNSMSSSSCLNIILRIPIWVIDNDNVSTCQVNSNSSCLCWEKKNISLLVWIVVPINRCLSFFSFNLTINPFISILLPFQKFFNKLKHVSKLRKYENFLPLIFTFFQ